VDHVAIPALHGFFWSDGKETLVVDAVGLYVLVGVDVSVRLEENNIRFAHDNSRFLESEGPLLCGPRFTCVFRSDGSLSNWCSGHPCGWSLRHRRSRRAIPYGDRHHSRAGNW